MRELLSFDQAPPIDVPLRFLFTAVPFGIAAGLLIAFHGDAMTNRWTPASLALTHLFTAGFMLQAMVGALLQLTPVAIGANLPRPRLLANVAHPLLTLGTIALVLAFMRSSPALYLAAVLALGSGIGLVAATGIWGLARAAVASASSRAMLVALTCLAATATLGAALALARGGLPAPEWLLSTVTHLRLGWLGWGLGLLAAASYLVVPMFQLTPQYPERFRRLFVPLVALALALSLMPLPAALADLLLALLAAGYAGLTLDLQRRRRRPRTDASFGFWRLALASTLLAATLAVARHWVDDAQAIELAIGVLVLVGGFDAVICAMMYKIVPFLTWLHLSRRSAEAPLMHQVIEESAMRTHLWLHRIAVPSLVLAAWLPPLALPAGLLLAAAHLVQARNMLSALGCYRRHLGAPAPRP